ncbi:Vitamin B12 import ATP-binding protein BtuD [Sporomusa silvacetica DSM 10669]|uniref:Vitamin B12 import ATP-binding protein BtuD n=1 Tax=Sporomusa silvacetica DSM 10669 TaxID=1123289 RepID=A0ABZ3INM4_9FIRM|nr:ABC transporter ATP-binding protein [Sporomusa silvacetica]OZC14757.1 spermidine/putrescine import ATP-binding protein PotA [Sporomusa silvacetica DSM 10669]
MYLILEKLTQRFGDKIVVESVTIDVQQGQLVTLLGPSGCGKTTLLKMIGGFLKPVAGRIVLDGVDITNLPPEQRSVATVFQNYALFPHMTVLENVMYGLRYKPGYSKKITKELAKKMLELVHLQDLYAQNVTRISGGQQQRVALARALILSPKVLLLDEPLSNLDAKLRIKIRQEIKDIQNKLGMTMLFVTHDQEEALSLSDRIVVMNRGKVEQIGTPQDIYSNPQNEFVANFVGRANLIQTTTGTTFIRPENLIPVETGGDYQGVIVQKQYMGSYTIYYIDTKKMILQMDVQNLEDNDWNLGQVLQLKVE